MWFKPPPIWLIGFRCRPIRLRLRLWMPRRAVSASDSTARFIRRDRFALAFRKASTAGAGKNLLSTLNPSRGGDFFPLGGIGLAEIAEPAFLEGAVREFQRDLRRPAGLRLGYIFHDAHGVGNSVDHGFAEVTRAGFRY